MIHVNSSNWFFNPMVHWFLSWLVVNSRLSLRGDVFPGIVNKQLNPTSSWLIPLNYECILRKMDDVWWKTLLFNESIWGVPLPLFLETPTDPNLLGHPNGRWAPDRSKAEAWVAKMNAEASAKAKHGDSRFVVFLFGFSELQNMWGFPRVFCLF